MSEEERKIETVNIPRSIFPSIQKKIYQAFEAGKDYERKCRPKEPEQISFSDYYKERLEYWKERFDKEPDENHVVVYYAKGEERAWFNSLQEAQKAHDIATSDWINNRPIALGEARTVTHIGVREIRLYPARHLSPYTPEEIEAWAKKKVEEEMKEWKVVKPDRPFGLDAFIRAMREEPWFIGTKLLDE